MEDLLIFFVLALIAEIIGTVSGFGSSILFVPLAALFFDFKIVLGITAVFHVFSNISKIMLFRKGIDKSIFIKLGIPAIVFVIIGALLTKYIPQKEIELGMSFVLLALSVYLIFNINKTIEKNNKNLFIGGTLSGFLAGLIGTGGAIRGLTLTAFNLQKDIFIATSALIDLGVDSSRAVIYIYNGYFLKEHIIYIPGLIVVSILGTWIGKKILERTSQKYFRYIVLGVILITSVVQSVNYFFK
ncbi:sulfite exporter TauE/SafE family protein [Flavobacterium enshiense]|uniref:sulfite exporter TauE/SafE family protein n=1 Tax=Flavobacterium enshiense TaxID=1341165 RepID=UPI00345C75C4